MKSLKSRKDFLDLRKTGKTFRPSAWLLISYAQKEGSGLRMGLTLAASVANAVTRNRLKRWCREYLRTKKNLDLDVNLVFLKQKNPSFFKELNRNEVDKVLDKFFRKIQ